VNETTVTTPNELEIRVTMRFATTEERDTSMQHGVEKGAKGGFARVDALLERLSSSPPAP
jgi:hypothetical protein